MIRQPIVSVLGHVDHGKTSLLDSIRGSAIAQKEAGGITQAIGASIINTDVIKKICGPLLQKLKLNLTIPGLLFIDTPGHAAFVNLRKRGGNIADIAIVVVDINEGIMPQTIESIQILKQYKTPFIIAANKIDLIDGWKQKEKELLKNVSAQQESTIAVFEKKLYVLVGKLNELNFNSDRFDRLEDYTKQIAIIPVSAHTKEGIPELLMVLLGLAQKYLESSLNTDVKGPAKGTVLEVKEEVGLGKVIDSIIYDGVLKVGDQVVIGGLTKPVVTKIKALFQPASSSELRDKKTKFVSVKEVHAATGVRVIAHEIEDVVSGMPLVSIGSENEEVIIKEIQKEIEQVIIETATEGIFIKADSLGSLEALSYLLKEKNIPIKKASIGPLTKKDVSDVEAMAQKNPLNAVLLAFNLSSLEGLPPSVKIISHNIIYKLIEDYEKWLENKKREIELKELDSLVKPCEFQIMRGYIFRQSNPAVVGIDILSGTLKSNISIMNAEGRVLSEIKGIQQEQEVIEKAEKGKQVAISLPGVIVGRQVKEGDILLSFIPEDHFKKYKEFKKYLKQEEIDLLKKIVQIMRKTTPMWGV